MKMGPVDYAEKSAPAWYSCSICGAAGVKLWREYNTFLNHQRLLCAACGVKDQKKNYDVDGDGKHTDPEYGYRSDQIGWLVPAVPTEDGGTFWGYTSVPMMGCDWWRGLPVREAGKHGVRVRGVEPD